MAVNFIFFRVHLNKPSFKPRCCVEYFLNYKHDNEARKAKDGHLRNRFFFKSIELEHIKAVLNVVMQKKIPNTVKNLLFDCLKKNIYQTFVTERLPAFRFSGFPPTVTLLCFEKLI